MSRERRRVLIVAPAFPPHPSPAAHRSRFLARYAPAFGWDVRVISVRPEHYAERPDFELERLLAADLQVRRVGALPYRAARALGFGDLSLRSLPFVLHAVRQECKEWQPDALFASAPPYFSFIAARAAKREFGVPYLLDYTDPWIFPLTADQRGLSSRAYWMDRIARRLEPGIARDAAHILAVSDATHDGLRARQPDIEPERFSALPIGFDIADYEMLLARGRGNSLWDPRDGAAHLLHAGAISPTGHETVRALLRGAEAVRHRRGAAGPGPHLHFIGTTYAPVDPQPVVLPIAAALGITGLVSEHPSRVPYIDALNAMSRADVVLILGSAEPHYTPSKVYNCIASGRPVLAICHEATRSLREAIDITGAGRVVTYGDSDGAETKVAQIAEALEVLMDAARRGATLADTRSIENFSARSMTRTIVDLLERVRRDGRARSDAA